MRGHAPCAWIGLLFFASLLLGDQTAVPAQGGVGAAKAALGRPEALGDFRELGLRTCISVRPIDLRVITAVQKVGSRRP